MLPNGARVSVQGLHVYRVQKSLNTVTHSDLPLLANSSAPLMYTFMTDAVEESRRYGKPNGHAQSRGRFLPYTY